jgi:hypothetical protein
MNSTKFLGRSLKKALIRTVQLSSGVAPYRYIYLNEWIRGWVLDIPVA